MQFEKSRVQRDLVLHTPNTMLTRYQHKRALYAEVMENPLILSNILSHLETIDGVNLMLSSKKFVESPVLKRETDEFIKTKKDEYKKKHDFVFEMINTLINQTKHDERNDTFRVETIYNIYNLILKYKTLAQKSFCESFYNVCKSKLIEFAFNINFTSEALYFLRKIYGIETYYEYSEDEIDKYGDPVMYIYIIDEDNNNEKIYI